MARRDMTWPMKLINTAFLTSMHEERKPGAFRGWSRFKMLSAAAGALFLWEAIPNYLFTCLSVFSWPT